MIDFFSVPVFMHLTRFDLVILGLCALLGVRGYFRGMVRDAVFLGGLALAMILARVAGPGAAVLIAPLTGKDLAPFAASAMIFMVITTASGVAAFIARKALRLARLSGLDRFLGCVLGVFSVIAVTGVTAGLAAQHIPALGGLMLRSPMTRLCIEAMRRIMGS